MELFMKKRTCKKNVLKRLGKRVHELRLEKNISVYELSQKANLKYSNMKKLDKGYYNIYLKEMFDVAKVLGVQASDLCIYY